MSNERNTGTENGLKPLPERPRYRAWLVQDADDGSAVWTEMTGLWPTKSGKGYCGTIRNPIAAAQGRLVVLPAAVNPGKEG